MFVCESVRGGIVGGEENTQFYTIYFSRFSMYVSVVLCFFSAATLFLYFAFSCVTAGVNVGDKKQCLGKAAAIFFYSQMKRSD